MLRLPAFLLSILMLMLLACAPAAPTISHAWVRAAPNGSALRVAYLDITSPGPADWIVAVDSDAHEAASLHESLLEDGISRMRMRSRIELPADATVSFEPGGLHIMLGKPNRVLAEGDTLMLTLTLESGAVISGQAVVSRQRP